MYFCGSIQKSISIHALREEGDECSWQSQLLPAYFYPRPPRGGRLYEITGSSTDSVFLSTPSARRATRYLDESGHENVISIHALREEGDPPGTACS